MSKSRNSGPAGDDPAPPGTFESLGRKLDQRPEVQAAEQALRKAQEQLERARQNYEAVREQATEGLHHVREHSVAELVGETLELVRKHPGPGVIVAMLCGWFAGRIFRR